MISNKLSFENSEKEARECFSDVKSLINMNCNLPRASTVRPGEETFTHIRIFKGDTFIKKKKKKVSSGDLQLKTLS